MTRQWRLAALAAMAMLVAGCASSSPAPARYTLPGTAAGAEAAGAEADHLLLLRPPRLAHYLDVEGLVMQVDDITLVEADRKSVV